MNLEKKLTYRHTDIQAYRHTGIHAYMHACMHACSCVCIYIHTHTQGPKLKHSSILSRVLARPKPSIVT